VSESDLERQEALLGELSRINSELVTSQRAAYSAAADVAHRRELEKQYVGMLAHDLNNPLQIVLGYAEVLLADQDLSEAQRSGIERIQRSARLMMSLVTDLSETYEEASGVTDERVRVSLADLVQSVVGRHQILSAHKELRLVVDTSGSESDPCTVRGDVVKIERVLNNLVGNAVKYSEPGGEIVVSLESSAGRVVTRVRDQGPGISEKGQQHIFDLFHREKETAGEPGVGLGLYISRQIAEQHGGTITVESALGEGSTFTFALPHDPGD
jgi:signal transduction histidine kinase